MKRKVFRHFCKSIFVNNKIAISIAIAIIIVIIGVIGITNQEITGNINEGKWVKSGPFEIDKAQYNVGEKIFLNARDLTSEDKGIVKFWRPLNNTHWTTHVEIQFNGIDKQQFNYYFEPRLNEWREICSMNDLAGDWLVEFSGTQYEDINFKILNQVSSWDERTFEPLENIGRC